MSTGRTEAARDRDLRAEAAVSSPPSIAPTRPAGRRLMWIALAAGLIALPFLSEPGRYVNDTRDTLWLAPTTYLSHVLQLWRNNPFLGFEQHDGIAFPMGSTVWLLHAIGLPAWAVERVWHGVLLFGAAALAILLIDALRGRRTVLAPLIGGLVYALTPFAFGYGLPFTGTFLAYVALPLLLLIVLRGVHNPGLRWPALFGLGALLMGGGNGAPQAYALITCGLFVAWIALFDREVPARQAIRFGAVALLFFIGINAYWLFLLGSSEIHNALLFSEVPKVINVDSSPSETARGLGLWLFYGGDQYGSWAPTVRSYVTSPLLVLTGFAVPFGALLSAWLVRWRFRLFFVLLAILAVFVAAGIFPPRSPTPFGRLLQWAYGHVPGASGLRTTYKFVATVELAFAVLIAMGVEPALQALQRLGRLRMAKAAGIAVAFAIVAANAFPLWTGHLYPPDRGMSALPGYWQQALHDLPTLDGQGRAFFAPATGRAYYRWGQLKEGVVAAAPSLAAIQPIRLPVGDRYGSNLLTAVEQPYFNGTGAAGAGVLFRYLGVSNVVLQNDLNWQRSHTARPFATHRLLESGDLRVARSFGAPGTNTADALQPRNPFSRYEEGLPPVEVLAVSDPLPIVRAETSQPVILSGDGFGLTAAATAGLLSGNPPVLYSAALSRDQLLRELGRKPRLIVTDTNRRRVWLFTVPQGHQSPTLPTGQTLEGRQIGWSLFGNRQDAQSVAVYPGLRSITASSDTGPSGSQPAYRPAQAFDGDPGTWWRAGGVSDPVGAWIRATFDRPRTLSRVDVTIPPASASRAVRRVRLQFSDGTSAVHGVAAGGTTTIGFAARRTAWIKLSIESADAAADPNRPVAVGDIGVPGLRAQEVIQAPTDLVRTLGSDARVLDGLPLTFLFERSRTGSPVDVDEEAGIDRRFDVPGERSFALAGSAHLSKGASDEQLDALLDAPSAVSVTSSTRAGGAAFRGSSAFDGNLGTEWVPAGGTGEWLNVAFPPSDVGSVAIATDLRPGRTPILGVRATLSDGTAVAGGVPDRNGLIVLHFPTRRISSIRITITSVFSPGRAGSVPVAIRDVHIPGVDPLSPRPGDESLPCLTGLATLDASAMPVRVAGSVADLLAGMNLPIGSCDGDPIPLTAGSHDLRVGGALQPDDVSLSSDGTASAVASQRPSALTWSSPADGRFTVHVAGASAPFYLVLGQNYNARWRATVAGESIGTPLLLDGYSVGWYVTRLGTYTIEIAYGPQRLYSLATAVTGGTLLAAVGIVLVSRRSRRAGRRRKEGP